VLGKILKNASALLLVQVLNPLLGMVFVIALARLDGALGLGAYTFALSLVLIFENIAGLGVREYLIREIGRNPGEWRALLNSALALGVVAALLAQLAMLLFAHAVGYDQETVAGLFIVSFALLPGLLHYLSVSFLYAFDEMTWASASFVIETVVRTAAGLLIVYLDLGMNWLLASFVMSRLVAALVAGWAQIRRLGWPGRQWDRRVFRDLLAATPTFGAMAILAAVYWRLNIVLLSRLSGAEAVGHYSAGYRLMDLIAFAGGSILTATYPAMTRLFHHFREDFRLLLDKGVQYALAGYLPIAVMVHELSPQIIALFFGPDFAPAVDGLRLLTWATLPLTLAKLFANGLVIAGRQNLDLRVNLYRLAANAVLSYVLIMKFGMLGACWALLLSLAASVVLQIYYLRAVAPLRWSLAPVIKPALAALALLAALELTSGWPLLLQALLAAASYAVTYLLLRPFDSGDRRALHCLGKQPVGELA